MAYDVNAGAAQVQENYQTIKNNYRFNAGMDLLNQMYGPVAWAPEQATATENYLYTKANNPLLLAQQGIANQQGQQNLDYSRQADPLRVKGLGLVNDAQTQTNQFNAQNDPLRIAAGQQTVKTGADAQAAADAARTKQALSGLVGTLGTKVNSGADPAATFDAAVADISALTGYPPSQLEPYRTMFIADPAGTVQRLQTALGAVDQSMMTQADRDAAAQAALVRGKTIAETTTIGTDDARAAAETASDIARNEAEMAKLAAETTAVAAKSAKELGNSTDVYDAQIKAAKLDAARAPLDNLDGENGYFAQAENLLGVMGTDVTWNAGEVKAGRGAAAEFTAAVAPILSNMTLQTMASMEEAGIKLTPMSDSDRQVVTNAAGMLDASVVPPAQLKKNLELVMGTYGRMMKVLDIAGAQNAEEVRKLGGMLPSDEGFVPGPKPTAPPRQQSGSVDMTGVAAPAAAAFSSLEAAWGQPLKVNSAYRDPATNKKVGGADHSQHMDGNAFDIDTSGMSQEERLRLIEVARANGFGGIGVYPNSIHADIGPQRNWGPDYKAGSTPDWAKPALGVAVVPIGPVGQAAPAPDPRTAGPLVDAGGGAAIDAARTSAVTAPPNATQPAQSQVTAPAAPSPQQVAQPTPGPVGGQPLTNEQLRNPDFVIPGSGGQTVGEALAQARAALKNGWTMQQIAARAAQFGIPAELITGRPR